MLDVGPSKHTRTLSPPLVHDRIATSLTTDNHHHGYETLTLKLISASLPQTNDLELFVPHGSKQRSCVCPRDSRGRVGYSLSGKRWQRSNNNMNYPPRLASHVPAIRCSTCGREFDLLSMESHKCSKSTTGASAFSVVDEEKYANALTANTPTSSTATAHFPFLQRPDPDNSFLRPQRPILPKIDSSVTGEKDFCNLSTLCR